MWLDIDPILLAANGKNSRFRGDCHFDIGDAKANMPHHGGTNWRGA
jgi:hypothetical protein